MGSVMGLDGNELADGDCPRNLIERSANDGAVAGREIRRCACCDRGGETGEGGESIGSLTMMGG